jgi:hypothetical protein
MAKPNNESEKETTEAQDDFIVSAQKRIAEAEAKSKAAEESVKKDEE